ncbi:hypothetical protein N0V90_003189 [Kalmusia sp. IMI 367209]|nr:hypothetical protein N0V90_003189 [Kalmusia sp. IMI 367209]
MGNYKRFALAAHVAQKRVKECKQALYIGQDNGNYKNAVFDSTSEFSRPGQAIADAAVQLKAILARKQGMEWRRRNNKKRLKQELQEELMRMYDGINEKEEVAMNAYDEEATLDREAEHFDDTLASKTSHEAHPFSDWNAVQSTKRNHSASSPSATDKDVCTPLHASPERCATPNRQARPLDALFITPTRRRSPQLEDIVSITSPPHIKTAASMLLNLKKRTVHLNVQISILNQYLVSIRTKASSSHVNEPTHNLASKIKLLEEIITAMEEHSNEVFMMEFALRDVTDERGGDLMECLNGTENELAESVRLYEKNVRALMERLDPEAVGKTLQEMRREVDEET